eukprot:TRINITY_DN3277_c0_g1_i2.p1 TRINITY_DN3277_c0_g1~~TRINITY_DN3277_c0_g1_i2.p1  ORF type:complete len:570 (-),score=143.24 TRINITY_DN3277_c0_g1_i2:315-2024(-)
MDPNWALSQVIMSSFGFGSFDPQKSTPSSENNNNEEYQNEMWFRFFDMIACIVPPANFLYRQNVSADGRYYYYDTYTYTTQWEKPDGFLGYNELASIFQNFFKLYVREEPGFSDEGVPLFRPAPPPAFGDDCLRNGIPINQPPPPESLNGDAITSWATSSPSNNFNKSNIIANQKSVPATTSPVDSPISSPVVSSRKTQPTAVENSPVLNRKLTTSADRIVVTPVRRGSTTQFPDIKKKLAIFEGDKPVESIPEPEPKPEPEPEEKGVLLTFGEENDDGFELLLLPPEDPASLEGLTLTFVDNETPEGLQLIDDEPEVDLSGPIRALGDEVRVYRTSIDFIVDNYSMAIRPFLGKKEKKDITEAEFHTLFDCYIDISNTLGSFENVLKNPKATINRVITDQNRVTEAFNSFVTSGDAVMETLGANMQKKNFLKILQDIPGHEDIIIHFVTPFLNISKIYGKYEYVKFCMGENHSQLNSLNSALKNSESMIARAMNIYRNVMGRDRLEELSISPNSPKVITDALSRSSLLYREGSVSVTSQCNNVKSGNYRLLVFDWLIVFAGMEGGKIR